MANANLKRLDGDIDALLADYFHKSKREEFTEEKRDARRAIADDDEGLSCS